MESGHCHRSSHVESRLPVFRFFGQTKNDNDRLAIKEEKRFGCEKRADQLARQNVSAPAGRFFENRL